MGSRAWLCHAHANAPPLSSEELRFGDAKDEEQCLVTVQRRGPYLLVSDNLQCGGLNVSFRGLYVRKKK